MNGGRRRLAEVVADGAEHHGDLLRARQIVDARRAPGRSPAACAPRRRLPDATPAPAGSRRAPAALGTASRSTPRSIASAKPIDGRGASSSFSISPQIAFGRQIVERNLRGTARASLRRASKLEPRRELHGAQHAQAVVAERRRVDHAQQPALEIAAAVERIESTRRSADPTRSALIGEVAPPRRFRDRHRRDRR